MNGRISHPGDVEYGREAKNSLAADKARRIGTDDVQSTGSLTEHLSEFQSELEHVRALMFATADELGSPLRELVRPRIYGARPYHFAALVLSAGYSENRTQSDQRTHLAAALEMLYVALGLHDILIASASADATQNVDDQRNLIGSTILAGDYCFSQAAQMAASTDNPTIVALFAEALQEVSSLRLRSLLSGVSENGDENLLRTVLMKSGAEAALELSDLDNSGKLEVQNLVDALVVTLEQGELSSTADFSENLDHLQDLPSVYRMRWRAYAHWLESNGSA